MKLYTTLGRCRRNEIRSTRNIEEMRAERSVWSQRSWVARIALYESGRSTKRREDRIRVRPRFEAV